MTNHDIKTIEDIPPPYHEQKAVIDVLSRYDAAFATELVHEYLGNSSGYPGSEDNIALLKAVARKRFDENWIRRVTGETNRTPQDIRVFINAITRNGALLPYS